MQTFLISPNFEETARCLDSRRLGKQRVEAWQILDCLVNNRKAWRNHPAVKQWKGYEAALCYYGHVMSYEFLQRGYKGLLMYDRFDNLFGNKYGDKYELPPWLKEEKLFISHKSNLLRKNKEYYSQFNWPELDNLPYFWPTKHGY